MNGIPITIHLDDVTFQFKEQQDFSWFASLEKVFTVFDQQDSGNVYFGIKKDGKKSFIKLAEAVSRAIEKNRNQRYTSVEEFYLEWEFALNKMSTKK